MHLYDITIIGGGLAGLSQAIMGASKGYKVLLIEKNSYPFHRVCGEYISNESRPFLKSLGVDIDTMKLPEINRFILSISNGNLLHADLPLGGFGISRYMLDNLLYERAKSIGAEVITGTKVENVEKAGDFFLVTSTNGDFKSKVVIGCFGKRSNLDTRWNRDFIKDRRKNYVGVKYHINYPFNQNTIALHHFRSGYCGISRVENDICCLCYLTTADALRQSGNDIKKLEEKILYQNPHLKKIFLESTGCYTQPLTISQISFLPKKQVENNILFCGDAAGLITPLCGNGMSMALHSGLLAFIQIDAFLQGKISRSDMEQMYITNWQLHFRQRINHGLLIQQITEKSMGINTVFAAMKLIPFFRNSIINRTHGKVF
jgi:flavin-dependent dehydrogenase